MPNRNLSGNVQTVLGLIEPAALGVTLTHEHLLFDQGCYFKLPGEASEREWVDATYEMSRRGRLVPRFSQFKDNARLYDTDAATEEVLLYKHAGGDSLVDVTNIGVGRDPLALARISRATGLNIVMGTGYYVWPSHPPDMDRKTEEDIADELVRDLTVGVGETGIRCGIIGEVGNMWPTNDNERKSLRASARAQQATGAAILIHPGFHPDSPPAIIDELDRAGADLGRVIIGHLGFFHEMETFKAIAEAGCYLEWDTFGREDTSNEWRLFGVSTYLDSDEGRMEKLEYMVGQGYEDRLVVGQDICFKFQLTRNGGNGYPHILTSIVPRLKKRGFTDKTIRKILVDNPRNILTFT